MRETSGHIEVRIHVRLHEVVTVLTLGTSAITYHAMLCAVDLILTVKRLQ